MRIMIPVLIILILGIWTLLHSVSELKSKIKNPFALGIYLFILPTVTAIQMTDAAIRHILKTKKKW